MGLRFRKSFKLFPGLRLNIAKKSASLSLGRPGMTVNLNQHGTKTTVGLPGSGVSYSDDTSFSEMAAPSKSGSMLGLVFLIAVLALIFYVSY